MGDGLSGLQWPPTNARMAEYDPMLIENNRAFLGVVVLSFLSCTQKPLTSDVGGARPIGEAGAAGAAANPEETVLSFEDAPRSLVVKPMSEAKQLEADAASTSDGKYVLEIPEGTFPQIERGTFIVRDGASRHLVFKCSGFYARWVSDTEVAFIDVSGQLTKQDVTDLQRITRGTRVCGSILECDSDEPPELDWVSRDLESAIIRGTTDKLEPFVVRKGEIAKLTIAPHARGFKTLALRVNKSGTLCTLIGRYPERGQKTTANIEANTGRLLCAEPPWTVWRHVRDFSLNGPFDGFDEEARLRFFSEREVVVSLPPSKAPTQNERYRHCIVSLDTATARCTPNSRPEWFPLGDGRWLVEATAVSVAPARLLDGVRSRSWLIGDDKNAVWWEPHHDSRAPGTLVFQREDKANVRAGSLVLPSDP
jgi:hypothetical protein